MSVASVTTGSAMRRRWLATERTGQAIEAYAKHGAVHGAESRELARVDLVERWARDRQVAPNTSRIILTHTNDEVAALNTLARERMRDSGSLGKEVAIRTERGTRMFAAGDRVLFLKNERGLGVKNGSLGVVESITPTRMALLLDDGKPVGFDLKDYAHIDYGYAATIHKAQGMTVDRVHVLATPRLDRHAAYVALSRHRDGVDLHYGRDDFANQERLIATLSRERGKDMASDYLRGLEPSAPAQKTMPTRAEVPEPGQSNWHEAPELSTAVTRHGRIVSAILFAQSVGDTASPDERVELRASRAALDHIRPHGAIDLESAFAADRGLIDEAAAGRTQAVIRAMQLEAELRVDPERRADMFVQRWQALDRQRRLLLHDREDSRARAVAQTMAGMAKGLERDPQVESILRNRKSQLGLPAMPERGIGQSLVDMLGIGRSRGPIIGM